MNSRLPVLRLAIRARKPPDEAVLAAGARCFPAQDAIRDRIRRPAPRLHVAFEIQVGSTGFDAGAKPRQHYRDDERYPSQDAQNSLADVCKCFGTRFQNTMEISGG